MRKRIALLGVVVLISGLAASTLVAAGTRSTVATPGERTAKAADSSRGPVTVQRLLQARLEWTRRLALVLRFLDQPPEPGKNGTNTIIDEPDPVLFGGEPNPEKGDSEDEPPPGSVNDKNSPPGGFQAS